MVGAITCLVSWARLERQLVLVLFRLFIAENEHEVVDVIAEVEVRKLAPLQNA